MRSYSSSTGFAALPSVSQLYNTHLPALKHRIIEQYLPCCLRAVTCDAILMMRSSRVGKQMIEARSPPTALFGICRSYRLRARQILESRLFHATKPRLSLYDATTPILSLYLKAIRKRSQTCIPISTLKITEVIYSLQPSLAFALHGQS